MKSKLDYDDLQHAPEDWNRYELFDGEVYVTPSSSPKHQRVSKRLQRVLEDYFEARDVGEVFAAPLDVILSKHDVAQSDLLVVPASIVTDRAIEGAPLLAVEILSPSTRERDRDLKAKRYAALGIEHYWIVDTNRSVWNAIGGGTPATCGCSTPTTTMSSHTPTGRT